MIILAILYAVASAFFHALHVIIITPILRRGDVSPRLAALYTLSVGTLLTGLISFVTLPIPQLLGSTPFLYLFLLVLSGLVGQGLARTANYYSVRLLGASRANVLVNAAPLFALPIAFTFMGETFSIMKVAGATLLMMAIALVGRELGSAEAEGYESKGQSRGKGFLAGASAALLYAIARLLRKVVVEFLPYPLLNSFIATGTAIPLMLLEEGHARVKDSLALPRPYALTLSLAGIAQVLGLMMEFKAYEFGEASTVIPARGTTPIFTALLSSILLKRYENITLSLLLASFLTALGIAALSL